MSPVGAIPDAFVPARHKGHPADHYQHPQMRPPAARPVIPPFDPNVAQQTAQPWCPARRLQSDPHCYQCNRVWAFWRHQIANEVFEPID
eukprot:1601059-Heterocapsa_arctica.AAC.1